ncbi:MAG TPA: hypothetical protein DCG49_03890 [Ruminococcus sp.]|nr:hypothetical protein [Ruminococcus sp.]
MKYIQKGWVQLKHQILRRLASLSAAAALSCSAVLGSGGLHAAAAQIPKDMFSALRAQQDAGQPVSVIVKVSGSSAMEQPEAVEMGSDYLETDQAANQIAWCESVQASVQNEIRRLYPALEIGYSYSTLFNGFSCKLPAELIPQVQALPDVIGVSIAEDIAVPQMNRAAALSGFPAYYDMTGCSGEGQVIAVIDSELDTSHPMFAPLADEIETAVSHEEIAEIANSGILNAAADPDRVYLSNKLPFVYDYLGEDPYENVPDEMSYHGTHVSGIAAGNAFLADDGTELSGIAKDAQLMFFACGEGDNISISAALAAFEDAVKLHVDVINLSWGGVGETFGMNPISEFVETAENAGIVICSAAGNYGNGSASLGRIVKPDNPDVEMLNDHVEIGSPMLLVASAENNGQTEAGTFFFADQQIVFRPTVNDNNDTIFLSDVLEPGDYEYVDCGYGSYFDMMNEDLYGKIVLVQRGKEDFNSIAASAEECGAVGVILADKEFPDGMDAAAANYGSPIAVITYHEGQMLRDAEQKIITITGEKVMCDIPQIVSPYSSWGVKESLDLRPDIMGIGGKVRSAAYSGGDDVMSGTSMSSPYVAGCTAVLRQYLKQQGMDCSGAEFSSYLRRLLMNTAIPYQENDLYISPRRQGAGLVSLNRAVSAKVLMSGSDGDAKINLFDCLGDQFSCDVTFTNISDEDVTFRNADLFLTTDDTTYDNENACEIVYGQQMLRCSTNLNSPFTVAAGDSVTLPVQVQLDAAQCSQIMETFSNGFFVEGFLMLSGAENSADISIPMLGYYGDWTQIPIIKDTHITAPVQFGPQIYCLGFSILQAQEMLEQARARLSEEEQENFYYDMFSYLNDEERALIEYGSDDVWISPDNDGAADRITGLTFGVQRWAKAQIQLLNENGEVVYENPDEMFCMPFDERNSVFMDGAFDQSALEDGDYTLNVKLTLDYPRSESNPTICSVNLHVDRTAPTVTSELHEENGRTILTIHASDDRMLQGVIVNGSGTGAQVGKEIPKEGSMGYDRLFPLNFIKMMTVLPMDYTSSFFNGELPPGITDRLPLPIRMFVNPSASFEYDFERFNFSDYILPETDDAGVCTVSYDVTDLRSYTFTILDYAYNSVHIDSVTNDAETFVQQDGVWMDQTKGLYEICGQKILFRDFYDDSVTEYSYTAEQNILTLSSDTESKSYTVSCMTDETDRFVDCDTGDVITMNFQPDMKHCSDMQFHPICEIIEKAIENSAAQWGETPVLQEYLLLNPYNLNLILTYGENVDGNAVEDRFYLSIINGRGNGTYQNMCPTDDIFIWDNRPVNLYEQRVTKISAGLYFTDYYGAYFQFFDDGESGLLRYLPQGNDLYASTGDTPFTYTLDAEGRIVFSYNSQKLGGTVCVGDTADDLYVVWDSEQDEFHGSKLSSFENFRMVEKDPDMLAQLRSSEELSALCIAYEQASTGQNVQSCNLGGTRQKQCYASFYGDDFSDAFDFDLFTLKGKDSYGNTFDLLNPPHLPDNAFSFEQIIGMARNEFIRQHDTEPDDVYVRLNQDGNIFMSFYIDYEGVADTYTINPVSGIGSNQDGERLNLPQTGNNDPASCMLLWLAVSLMCAGAGVVCCTVRRVRKEDNIAA